MAQGHGGVSSRDPLGPRPGLAERVAHDIATAAVGHGHERVGRGGVLGKSPATARHVGTDFLRRASFERRPAPGGVEVRAPAGVAARRRGGADWSDP